MSDRLDAARHFVDSWDDPEMRRFAEEYAAEQAIDFARLAVAQAGQIKRMETSLSIASRMADKWAAHVDETIGDIGDD